MSGKAIRVWVMMRVVVVGGNGGVKSLLMTLLLPRLCMLKVPTASFAGSSAFPSSANKVSSNNAISRLMVLRPEAPTSRNTGDGRRVGEGRSIRRKLVK